MNDKMRLNQFDYSLTAHAGRAAEITVHSNREAYICILDGLERQLKDGELCETLARHDDFCELAAQVAVVRKLQRELGGRDATDVERSALNQIRRSSNLWLHREAGNLLMQIADERGQVAAHDGEVEAHEKRYRLRCGAIVAIPKVSKLPTPVKFIEVSQADFGSRVTWEVGEKTILIHNGDANPLNWKGGAHGVGLDIIEEVTE